MLLGLYVGVTWFSVYLFCLLTCICILEFSKRFELEPLTLSAFFCQHHTCDSTGYVTYLNLLKMTILFDIYCSGSCKVV